MTTLAEHIIVAGAENRPPMLEKSMYDLWASRIRLFIKGKTHGRMMLDSIDNGLLVYPTIEEDGQTRLNKYSELTEAQQLQDDYDVQATNIILHGLPPDVYALINHQKTAKDIWDKVKLLMKGIELSYRERECILYKLFDKLASVQGETFKERIRLTALTKQYHSYLLWHQGFCLQTINSERLPILEIRKPFKMEESQFNKFKEDKLRVLLALETKELLQPQGKLCNWSSKGCECYNCLWEWHMTKRCTQSKRPRNYVWFKEKLMLVEAQKAGQILDEDQLAFISDSKIAEEVQEISYSEQTHIMDFPDNEITSDSNIIPYPQYLQESQDTEESRSKILDTQNDPISIKQKINISPIDYSKLNKIKEDFGKRFVTKKELSAEQAFWLKHSNYNPDTSVKSHTPVRIEAPSKLPKDMIKSLSGKDSVEKVKKDIDETKTINIDIENELRKLKGKNVVDTAVLKPSATIAPGMFKLNIEPSSHRLKNNRDAHEVYLEKTIENTNTLRGLVECARKQNRSQLLLESVACLQNTFMNFKFAELVTSSSNIPKQIGSLKTKDSNKPLLTSTGVKPTTSASGSKPSGNTKNNRISRPPSRNQKNKVKEHHRKVKSSLNKMNYVSEPISNAHVKHFVRNAKVESICAICNKCLFDANHDMCVINYVNYVNVHSKSKRNKMRKVWKPTGKVFNEIEYSWKPTRRTFTIVGSKCPLTRITSTKVVPNKETTNKLVLTPTQGIIVYSRRSKAPKLVKSSSYPNCSVVFGLRMLQAYDQKSLLTHQLRQFCDSDLEVAFHKHTCFIRDLEGVDLLNGSRGSNLYTLSMNNLLLSSPICLLSKASKTKSWLWHRRLSHLTFDYIISLAKQGLVQGLPKVNVSSLTSIDL
nr:integrase, catalytic region, zinc finger, CCHC-type, peptidase aspartic, catalytic [Tanacetum cinerariifolium]